MQKNRDSVTTILVSGAVASLAAVIVQKCYRRIANEKKKDESSLDSRSKNSSKSLGPAKVTPTRYELSLRGNKDNIFEHCGPKPFEFNHEVVEVFDDMVSRSVPLYCEVIDLAIYWMHKYYQPGTVVYDLGCSTGTTIDVLARSFSCSQRCRFRGVDSSEAMVQACKEKLDWAKNQHDVEIHCGDILDYAIKHSSFVIMNYTLQFIPISKRQQIIQSIYDGLRDGGIFFLSEKVRILDTEMHDMCTSIYEDFKVRRKYTRREIARKKEALMNVLVPYTEVELKNALSTAGFDNVEVVAKWNNFTTFACFKSNRKVSSIHGKKTKKKRKKTKEIISTPHLDELFDPCLAYLSEYIDQRVLDSLQFKRSEAFVEKGCLSNQVLKSYDYIAHLIQLIPPMKSQRLIYDEGDLTIGDPDELNDEQKETLEMCLKLLRPWKKGPLNIFGIKIDTEWRSDWKWQRLQESLPDLKDKVVCDLGCGNGYYMFRMLEYGPKLVIGIDPNMHAFLEFKLFQRFSGVDNLKFEFLRGDSMVMFPKVFDVVFCLGVLYHTHDPIGMLREIHESMSGNATLVVDCQGIPGDEPVALFPTRRYANMRGVYFLPTVAALKNWLTRTGFVDFEVIFGEAITIEEQKKTEWAPVKDSLKESLMPNDPSTTIEGYPAPHRFYVRVRKG